MWYPPKKYKIKNPIFVIGVPRSGNTVFSRMLGLHKDLAWFSQYSTVRIPGSAFLDKILRRLLGTTYNKKVSWIDKFKPLLMEANQIWGKYSPGKFMYQSEKDVTYEASQYFRSVIKKELNKQGKSRILIKNPGISVRIRFFNKIFPNSIFIHIIRDGRAVTHSIISKHISKNIGPQYYNFSADLEFIRTIAQRWVYIIQILDENKFVLNNRYKEIKYEDFTKNPVNILKEIVDYCDLKWYKKYENLLPSSLPNYNYKWKKDLNNKEVNIIFNVQYKMLSKLNYI